MRDKQIALLLLREKLAGKVLSVGKGAVKLVSGAGKGMAQALQEAGVKSPAALGAAQAAPWAAVLYGAKKGYESEPVQRLKMKLQQMKYKRQMKKAMEQRGYQ